MNAPLLLTVCFALKMIEKSILLISIILISGKRARVDYVFQQSPNEICLYIGYTGKDQNEEA